MASAFFVAEFKFQKSTVSQRDKKTVRLDRRRTILNFGNSALQPADRTKQFVYGCALPGRFWQRFQFTQSLSAFT
jgi:hypothetical protein